MHTSRPAPEVQDDRTGMSPEAMIRAVLDHVCFTQAKELSEATPVDLYLAVSHAVRDRLVHRWMHTQRRWRAQPGKRVCYLSMEYLPGRFLAANLHALGQLEFARASLAERGFSLDALLELEPDPGLGNGGLGRLAACFMESMATLGVPGYGYGIRYEFGIFKQEIVDGQQEEHPDPWLRRGNPWEIPRPEYTVPVPFGGHVEHTHDSHGHYRPRWVPAETVLGVPYDTPIPGHGCDTVNLLRLWSARASEEFDLKVFNAGDYRRAVEKKALSESISKVLYPNDQSPEGRELRLRQQFFFVCCSIHDILRRHLRDNGELDSLPEKTAIQLNDTHPALAIPELMRALMDEVHLGWEEAWAITARVFSYTNHTLMPEALETWPWSLLQRLLPRHAEILQEINLRFLRQVHVFAPTDFARRQRMSIVSDGAEPVVRMAHLCVVGSHTVNGVAALHSQLLRTDLFRDFAEIWPERFVNVTNGVTPRRWILQCNPALSALLDRRLGEGWIHDTGRLSALAEWEDDPELHEELFKIKLENKVRLAELVTERCGVTLDPSALFDVQIKRIHEYKRQVLAALHAVALYARVKLDGEDIAPRVLLFAGKAAPGYRMAKLHIRLIHDIAALVNRDPDVRDLLKVVFVPNYSVSLAERIIPGADLSEQISMAGKEASGTGNMKLQMNGALTIGTSDGANIEIREAVGADSFFTFGLEAEAARALKTAGYVPERFIAASPELSRALRLVEQGSFSPEDPARHHELTWNLRSQDPFLVCADFDSYAACQREVEAARADSRRWMRMVVRNIAGSGAFSSDRSIREYAARVWRL